MRRPIAEGLFTDGAEGPRLIGATCSSCGAVTFPLPERCPRCASEELAQRPLSTTGTLWTFTVQAYPPKAPYRGPTDSVFEPFGLGYVELPDDKVIVEARLTEADPEKLRIGMPMQLLVAPVYDDPDGTQVISYAFAPAH